MEERAREESTRLNNLGVECGNRGDIDGAIRYYRQALAAHPGNPAAKNNLNLCNAIKAYERGMDLSRDLKWGAALDAFREAERLHRLHRYDEEVRYAEEHYNREREEERKHARSNQVSQSMLQEMIAKSRTGDAGATAGFDFIQEKEPQFSKGATDSAPAALSGETVDIGVLKSGEGPARGLKTKEVPRFVLIPPSVDPYSAKTRAEIVLSALEEGERDWDRSIGHLKDYLATRNPYSVRVQEALSYLEGLRARNREFEPDRKPALFDPHPKDSEGLLEAVPPPKESFLDRLKDRFGSKEDAPAVPDPAVDPEAWRYKRNAAILEAAAQGEGDSRRTLDYLDKKVAADEMDFTSRHALQFLEGYYGYGDFVKEQASRKGGVNR
jgi:tetratricopeptide (TPR) repeat protein